MKKWISMFLFFAVLFTLTGCEGKVLSSRSVKEKTGVNDVLEAGMAGEDAPQPEPINGSEVATESTEGKGAREDAPQPKPINESEVAAESMEGLMAGEDASQPETINESEIVAEGTEGIDVDLTVLSSTMVYSEVYNMMASPENYMGKTVKMGGSFAFYHDEVSDNDYYACIIADAAACCSQGIEFILTDDYTYPDDYPEQGGDICVVGVFDTYKEGGYTYCTLRNARIV